MTMPLDDLDVFLTIERKRKKLLYLNGRTAFRDLGNNLLSPFFLAPRVKPLQAFQNPDFL
jgi:hypothetical protein